MLMMIAIENRKNKDFSANFQHKNKPKLFFHLYCTEGDVEWFSFQRLIWQHYGALFIQSCQNSNLTKVSKYSRNRWSVFQCCFRRTRTHYFLSFYFIFILLSPITSSEKIEKYWSATTANNVKQFGSTKIFQIYFLGVFVLRLRLVVHACLHCILNCDRCWFLHKKHKNTPNYTATKKEQASVHGKCCTSHIVQILLKFELNASKSGRELN